MLSWKHFYRFAGDISNCIFATEVWFLLSKINLKLILGTQLICFKGSNWQYISIDSGSEQPTRHWPNKWRFLMFPLKDHFCVYTHAFKDKKYNGMIRPNTTHNPAGKIQIYKCRLTTIGNPIVEIRRSYDRLLSTMWFPTLLKQHLYTESVPKTIIYSKCESTDFDLPRSGSTGISPYR